MKQIIILLFIALGGQFLNAQQVILSSAQEAISSTARLSVSVGQLLYQSNSGDGGHLIEGIQQAVEIIHISKVTAPNKNFELEIYPNPATDFIIILNNTFNNDFAYKIYTLKGKLIIKGEIKTPETHINIENLPQGNYIISIYDNTGNSKVSEIIKQ